MSFLYHTGPALFMGMIGVYLCVYFKRTIHFIWKRRNGSQDKKYGLIEWAAAAFLAVCLILPALDIWGFWALVILYFAAFLFLTDLGALVLKQAGKHWKFEWKHWDKLYRSGLLPVLFTIIALAYGYGNMTNIVRQHYLILTDKWIPKDGYRICMISDLHYPTTMNAEQLKLCLERIQKEEPDLLVLDGDIVDENTTKEEMEQVFRCLSQIETTFGIYYVYGNHDRGFYSKRADFTALDLEAAVNQNGIWILKDGMVTIQDKLTLIGREDKTKPGEKKRKTTEELIAMADPSDFILLLDHQPRDLKENAALGYDLQLSGHTHGGQIWPTGEISDLLGFGEMNYGYRRIGSFQVIVSSGLGGGTYPIRTGHHSEYVVVDIHPASVFEAAPA